MYVCSAFPASWIEALDHHAACGDNDETLVVAGGRTARQCTAEVADKKGGLFRFPSWQACPLQSPFASGHAKLWAGLGLGRRMPSSSSRPPFTTIELSSVRATRGAESTTGPEQPLALCAVCFYMVAS